MYMYTTYNSRFLVQQTIEQTTIIQRITSQFNDFVVNSFLCVTGLINAVVC